MKLNYVGSRSQDTGVETTIISKKSHVTEPLNIDVMEEKRAPATPARVSERISPPSGGVSSLLINFPTGYPTIVSDIRLQPVIRQCFSRWWSAARAVSLLESLSRGRRLGKSET